ncbi:MAG: hypothetical protein RL628_1320, partial [Actinomycetota bacterium]
MTRVPWGGTPWKRGPQTDAVDLMNQASRATEACLLARCVTQATSSPTTVKSEIERRRRFTEGDTPWPKLGLL